MKKAAPFRLHDHVDGWLKAIDVESASSPGAIVAFGDSITDGTCSTLDAHDRWEDVLSMRLGFAHGAIALPSRGLSDGLKAVVNEGIGGNTITREGLTPPADSTPGLERLDRDVLSHHGVTDVILFMGTNDIRRGATAGQVVSGMTSIIQKVRAKGIRVVGVTIIPRHNSAPNGANTGWNPEKTRVKNAVNQWIRSKAPFDKVIDFDLVVRDPQPDLIRSRSTGRRYHRARRATPWANCGVEAVHPVRCWRGDPRQRAGTTFSDAPATDPAERLKGVVVVAGATRGAGRGIACPWRSRRDRHCRAVVFAAIRRRTGAPETLDETAEMINAAGGTARVRVDHTVGPRWRRSLARRSRTWPV
jgi:lysophospholipase L1-like esterase